MKSIFTALRLTATVLALFLFSSCAVNPVTGRTELMLVSESQEMQIGKSAVPSANWEFGGQYKDPALESYLSEIVGRLWSVSERSNLPWEFHIQNSSIPNAFALPGYVAITRGLLCEMENEAQFAAVMGHEIAHVMARHTAQKLSMATLQQLGLALGATALQGKSGGNALLKLGAIGSSLLLLKYDRSQELQADRLGVKYMSLIGYDPREALRAHKVLEQAVNNYLQRLNKSPREDSFISNLLSTHPRTEVRLSEIQSMINALPPHQIRGNGKFGRIFREATREIRDVNRVYHLYDKAEDYYKKKDYVRAEEKAREAIRLNDRQPPFFTLLGFIKLQNKAYPDAAAQFDRSLALDRDYQPAIYGFGLVRFFEEKYDRAIVAFKDSLKLYPNHLGSNLGIAKSYFNLRQYSRAIPYFKKIADAIPRHPEVHGLLGICYENTGEIHAAAVEYDYQIQVAPDTELGRYAKKRLAILLPLLQQK